MTLHLPPQPQVNAAPGFVTIDRTAQPAWCRSSSRCFPPSGGPVAGHWPIPVPAGPRRHHAFPGLDTALADTHWDTVERHGGFDVFMEKIVQWEQENPASNGRGMIDDFRLRGSRRCRRMGGHLSDGGWRTKVAHVLTTPTLLSQRAKSSPLWFRLCPETRIEGGLARILRILCSKAPCGAAGLARRVAAPHRRGRRWRERPPYFWRWCATRAWKGGQASGHLSALVFGVAPSTVIPGGKAIEHFFALTVAACVSM